MSFLPWDDGEASLAETLVDQAVLPERPEPTIPQEVQCFLAEVLPQDVLHVCNVLRKGGEVGKEPFRPFPAHMEFQCSLSRGFHFPDLPGPPMPPLQKLRLLEWGWVISREPPQLVLAVPPFSSGEKFSLSLPSAAAMRRSHRLSQRSAKPPADKGWGSLPAADATRPLK